ncbi:RibD family protein [Histomonas meleagridis]|uniref:RibD family protein n=1 Tax=Histomonas meleagridis TaxID=135588 RepID=UPI00355A5217|nr:RibD family protein [Histomonas meleagridis]KAH0805072.1 RibD family protein [Histomonas meleagridis]
MSKPYVICHMLTTLDGKIAGPFMKDPAAKPCAVLFEETRTRDYKLNAWCYGRITTDESYTKGEKPELDENAPQVPEGDFVAKDNCDHGKRPEAHIIEVLGEDAPNSYRAFLRKLGISYIIAGKEHMDCPLAMTKLKNLFHIDTLMVSGGGYINYTYLHAGMIDELSIILSPIADGENNTVTLFEKSDFMESKTFTFTLKSVEKLENNCVWLRYMVNK